MNLAEFLFEKSIDHSKGEEYIHKILNYKLKCHCGNSDLKISILRSSICYRAYCPICFCNIGFCGLGTDLSWAYNPEIDDKEQYEYIISELIDRNSRAICIDPEKLKEPKLHYQHYKQRIKKVHPKQSYCIYERWANND